MPHSPVLCLLGAPLHHLLAKVGIGTQQVGLEALGGLVCELDGGLQDGDGQGALQRGGRLRRQEQPAGRGRGKAGEEPAGQTRTANAMGQPVTARPKPQPSTPAALRQAPPLA